MSFKLNVKKRELLLEFVAWRDHNGASFSRAVNGRQRSVLRTPGRLRGAFDTFMCLGGRSAHALLCLLARVHRGVSRLVDRTNSWNTWREIYLFLYSKKITKPGSKRWSAWRSSFSTSSGKTQRWFHGFSWSGLSFTALLTWLDHSQPVCCLPACAGLIWNQLFLRLFVFRQDSVFFSSSIFSTCFLIKFPPALFFSSRSPPPLPVQVGRWCQAEEHRVLLLLPGD